MNNAHDFTDFANQLSAQDMCNLISIWSDRINVFVGSTGNVLLTGELSKENPACMNGPVIQINMEFTDEEEGRDFMQTYGDYIQLKEQENAE